MTHSPNPAPEPAPEKSATSRTDECLDGNEHGNAIEFLARELKQDFAQARAELEKVTRDRRDLLSALNFRDDAMSDEQGRNIVLGDARSLRPEMVKARKRVSEIRNSLGHWFDEEVLGERFGEGMLLKFWRKMKEIEKERDQARDTIKALREALEKGDKLIDSLWDSVPWGQTQNLDIAALNTVPGLIKQALASTQEDAP